VHRLFKELINGLCLRGDVRTDIPLFLKHHRHSKTAEHSRRVAAEAKCLAVRFGADETKAELAGWLHDISAVFPWDVRALVARQLGLEVLPEEQTFPMIVHQKISAVMAGEIFGITDRAVLDAIRCHTTLKTNATTLDKVIFVADKIEWDGSGTQPFLEGLLTELDKSMDEAVFHYLDYLWQGRETLPVLHPWLVEAYYQLRSEILV
jgi:predicted HD superfamily hydrolase involved in NAD metabolism